MVVMKADALEEMGGQETSMACRGGRDRGRNAVNMAMMPR
jgi:hypothetical protein